MSSTPPQAPAPGTSHETGTTLRPGPLGRLAGFAYRRRGLVVLSWIVVLIAVGGLSIAVGGEFKADYSAPRSDSSAAQKLLSERFGSAAGASVDVVVQSSGGVLAPDVRSAVGTLLARMDAVPHVSGFADPYASPGSISPDGHTLLATLRLDVTNPVDMPVTDAGRLLRLADGYPTGTLPGVTVALGGQAIEQAEQAPIGSEALGLSAAAVILLITFGSLIAAGLPIVVAVAGLAVSSFLTGLVTLLVDAPDWSTSLATMMGIGIGVDYALLMLTRFREWCAAGLDEQRATVATLDTAGRCVLMAGSTVLISMFGLFAMGLSFMRGAALVTIVSVFVVIVASVTLFPALLGYVGRHVDRLRLPIGRRSGGARVAVGGHVEPTARWLAWSRFVERHRLISAAAGVAILLALAAPFLGVTFGYPDAGNDPAGNSTRRAYDRVAAGFGPGANGPLLLIAELPAPGDTSVLDDLSGRLSSTPAVAAVTSATVSPAGNTAMMSVIPTTGPQDRRTEQLVHQLRDVTIPAVVAGTGTDVHVGGVTAASIDSTANIARRIPLLIGGVVLLSMLLLLVAFRSVAVALKAAAMNLLSVGAAYGIVALVLQGGWAGRLVGIDSEAVLPAFVPVLMFAVLFGLSMDYEVFLVSRMREAWTRTGDNGRAIVEGLAGTGRVITAAAAIMVAVFAAFVLSPDLVLKVIGVGMASAIFIDATVVRMLLVPSVMHLLGRANWWLPAGMGRLLPQLHVEGRPERHLPVTARPASARPASAG